MKKNSLFPAYTLYLTLGFIGGAVADRLVVSDAETHTKQQTKVEIINAKTTEDKEAIFQHKLDSLYYHYNGEKTGLRNEFHNACDSIENSRGTTVAKNAAIAKKAKQYNEEYNKTHDALISDIIELNQKYR